MSFLHTPQLPRGRVTRLAIGEKYRSILEEPLLMRGVACEWLPGLDGIDERIAGHADLMLLHMGGDRFIAAEELTAPTGLPSINKVPVYKNDAALNICIVGEYCICCKKTAAVIPAEKTVISVKQRYARCSVCIVDERSIITADQGIANAVAAYGIDCLLIEPGHIHLEGFPYGFLGGASFKLAQDQMAFTGTPAQHPDGDRIVSFLAARDIEAVSLTERPIFDIGSAVLLNETIPFTTGRTAGFLP